MRTTIHAQLALVPAQIRHERGREYAEVSAVLDATPEVLDLVLADLLLGKSPDTGRPGMSAEQVVRGLVVRQAESFSYEQLAFHVEDSSTFRRFCRIGVADDVPDANTWQDNVKRLTPATLEAINAAIVGVAKEEKVEDGKKVRGDCTVVETDIHHPTDSSLLWDCVRVLTRLLLVLREAGVDLVFSNHTRRAKRRAFGIDNARGAKKRLPLYRDLLKVTKKTVGYAQRAVEQVSEGWGPVDGDVATLCEVLGAVEEMRHVIELAYLVIDQTECRVLRGETVPAEEKVFSIFEPHTDIVVKGNRGPEFGHKVFLSTGASGLVLDCIVLEGNPADSTLVDQFIERHVQAFGSVPKQTAFDGGFTSKDNLARLKEAGVKDALFHKKRGLSVSDMVRSTWVYRQLKGFRAGIESTVSWLKRCFGWTRCRWRGFESFVSYTWASVVTANLFVFARHRLADG